MDLNLNIIKNIILNDLKNLRTDSSRSAQFYCNKIIFNNIQNKYHNVFKNINELVFLKKNEDDLNNIHIFCVKCGKKNKFLNKTKGYNMHCSTKCSNSDIIVRNKVKSSLISKYGVDNYTKTNEYLITSCKTKLEKYGDAYFTNRDKYKETCLNKYGVDNYAKTENHKMIYNNLENLNKILIKARNTNLKKYGVDHYSKTQKFKDKYKTTCLQKYGVDNILKSSYFKDKMKLKQKEIVNKRNKTKQKNHTFNSSKIENICNIKLKSKFPDVVHHYSADSRYPFECDFYIPSKDLFIELNFHWTHGKEPFDKNNSKHKIQLDLWKSKNTKFYNKAIEVWTERDILKLETFKKNNLNYKIFYNQNIFEEWLNNVIDFTR